MAAKLKIEPIDTNIPKMHILNLFMIFLFPFIFVVFAPNYMVLGLFSQWSLRIKNVLEPQFREGIPNDSSTIVQVDCIDFY